MATGHVIMEEGPLHEDTNEYYRPLNMLMQNIIECFGVFVCDLENVVLSNKKKYVNDSNFLCAMTDILKLARKDNIPLKITRLVMNSDLIRFLVYEVVILSEQLLIAQKKKQDPLKVKRRLHLTINAVKESLKTLSKYSNDDRLDEYDRNYITNIQKDLANLRDLRMMFLLVLRSFTFKDKDICFLEDVIITNNIVLELVDYWNRREWITNNFSMLEHVKQFGTRNIMGTYGLLLENFEANSHEVNICVFTMMHHVAGDCQKPDVFMQAHIIHALMEVDTTKNNLTKEMIDLTEYLLNKFAKFVRRDPFRAAVVLYGNFDMDMASSENKDAIVTEVEDLHSDGRDKDVDTVISQMAEECIVVGEKKEKLNNTGLELCKNVNGVDVIRECVDALKKKNQENNIKHLRTLLCETASVKLGKQCERTAIWEPVTKHHVLRGISVPIVLYTEDHEAILTDHHFAKLLHYLGVHMPSDIDMIFPRIPSFWTPEQLFRRAETLGTTSKGGS